MAPAAVRAGGDRVCAVAPPHRAAPAPLTLAAVYTTPAVIVHALPRGRARSALGWLPTCGRMHGQVRRVNAEVIRALRKQRRPGTAEDHNAGSNPWAAWPSDHFASALSAAIVLAARPIAVPARSASGTPRRLAPRWSTAASTTWPIFCWGPRWPC